MADFDSFRKTLLELVEGFSSVYSEIVRGGLDEANLRLSYLDPLFEALGWDIRNTRHAPLHAREVVVEPPSEVGGRWKRPDYLFRVGGIDKFVCEAKRPRDYIQRHYFQTQNYVYNLRLWVGVLSDFEHLIVFVVGGQPSKERPFDPAPGWRLHYRDFEGAARRIWDLLARQNVAAGSLERFAQSLPKVPRKEKQGWLLKPDRNKTVDNVFLTYLEERRRRLAKALHDDNMELPSGQHRYWSERDLTEGTQRVIDRILFQRICEDRDIDIGRELKGMRDEWEVKGQHRGQLWPMLVANFRHLHRTFNGGIYGKPGERPHFTDELQVSDSWLSDIIEELSAEDSQYIFSIIPVEILGSVYERFLGSVVRPDGEIELKPEVRKAGGVYYTPRFIVEYIVENTVGKLLKGKSPTEVSAIKVLDPACGSGSFLLWTFERICQHHVEWFLEHPKDVTENICYADTAGNVRLTTGFKRNILVNNIFGVDLDPQAVEVTQMSLYLKVLEDESRQTLERDRRLFPRETYLPDLSRNIKCGNSLIGPESYDEIGDDEVTRRRVNPFDWAREFKHVMKVGGFDAVIGNPPYVRIQTLSQWARYEADYLKRYYASAARGNFDIYVAFIEKGLSLLNPSGKFGMILPHKFFSAKYGEPIRGLISQNRQLSEVVHFGDAQIFERGTTYTCLLFLNKSGQNSARIHKVDDLTAWKHSKHAAVSKQDSSNFTSSEWTFQTGQVGALISRLSEYCIPLGTVAARIFQAPITSADTIYIFEEFEIKQKDPSRGFSRALGKWVEIESGLLKPVIRSGHISRYEAHASALVIFPYEVIGTEARLLTIKELKEMFPLGSKYLYANKSVLRQREKGKFATKDWYRFGRTQNLGMWEQPKLMIPYMVKDLSCFPDTVGGFYFVNVTTGGYGIVLSDDKIHPLYVCGILNSRLLNFIFKRLSTPFRSGYFAANKQFIEKLPVKVLGGSKAERRFSSRMVDLVRRMLELVPKARAAETESDRTILRRAIDETNRQIDALVYELYDLRAWK